MTGEMETFRNDSWKLHPFAGKPVCWCKPVQVEKGMTRDVRLTAEDMIELETM